jgi:hypothetical protein
MADVMGVLEEAMPSSMRAIGAVRTVWAFRQ